MLDTATIRKIEEFVASKPRSVHEIAQHIGRSWRTADRNIDEISKNFGTVSTRVFRGGTKGALKIVYWSSFDKSSSTVFQQRLEDEILRAKKKEDFSAFDIFQYVDKKKKYASIERASSEDKTDYGTLQDILSRTKKQLLIFSGNLSFINIKNKNVDMFALIESLVKKKIIIKILCRVDLVARENVEKVLSLNHKYGKDLIEIRHHEHPLRAFIIDNEMFNIKEIKEPTGKTNELDKKIFIFYRIMDTEWTAWLTRIFWKLFNNSIDSNKRIEEMNNIRI